MEVMSLPRAVGTTRLSPRLLAPLPDNRLVHEIRRGSEAAFEVVYDRHHRGLLSFCRHMLGSQEESEDAVQQTFASAYRDLMASEKQIRLKPWLYTIARNRCLSVLRARREEAAELADIPTAGLSDAVVEREEVRRLLADVRRLPDDQRAALVLSELGDLSHADIAQIVGCEPVQVKALVFQARSSLIASREAADVPCHEIREEIATARGAALRRGVLRRHMKACPACAAFRDEVRRQRQLLALALPVVPTVALKNSVLTAAGLGHAATGGVAGGGALAGCTGASGSAAAGGTAAGGAGLTAGVGGASGGGMLASIGALGGTKLAVIAVVAAGVAGGGVALDEVAISQHGGASPGLSTRAGASGAATRTAAGAGALSGRIFHAFGARIGSGLATAAAAGGNAYAYGQNGGNPGRGHGGGKGNGHGQGNGHGAAPQSFQMQPGGNGNAGGNGNGNAYGNGSGSSSGSGSAGGNAYGKGSSGGNGNGNAYGNGSASAPAPAGSSSPAPNGNAYGVYGHPQPTGSSGQHGGGHDGSPGKPLSGGHG